MSKRIAFVAAALLAATGLAVSAATAAAKKSKVKTSSHMLVGINDEADTLYGDPVSAFATLKTLRTQVLRVNLYWGGTKWGVANSGRPQDPWLEPDVNAYLRDAYTNDRLDAVILAPLGFVCDHVEVLYDLDVEANHS